MSGEIENILADLQSPNAEIRESALNKIGELKPAKALELILPFLSDPDEEVRSTAAFHFGEFADSDSILQLIQLIKEDPSEAVRREAICALEHFRSPEIEACLILSASRSDQSLIAKNSIAKQLGNYDSGSSVDALVILLSDWDVYTRESAADSLYKLNRPILESAWKKALTDRSYIVRNFARKALYELEKLKSG